MQTLTKKYTIRALRLAPFASIVIVAAFWVLRMWQAYTIETTAAHRMLVADVFAVGGLKVDLSRALELPGDTPSSSGRKLLLFSATQCKGSAAELTSWKRLIGTLPFREDDQLILANIGGEAPNELVLAGRERGVRVRSESIHNIPRWVATTGLSGTPSTVALDEDGRIELFISKVDDRASEMLTTYFGRGMQHDQ